MSLLRLGLVTVLALNVDSAGTVLADEAFRDRQHFASAEMTDKYPSIAVDAEGKKWIAWAGMSRNDLTDGIYLRNANAEMGRSERVQVSTVLGVETTPVLLAGPDNSLHVVWTAKRNANWDIFLRQRIAGEWGDEIRVTTDSANDENPRADITGDGTLVLVWESNRDGNYRILTKQLSVDGWSETVSVSDNECDSHRPALALVSSDEWRVAWDCAVSGNYDIYLRSVNNGKWSETERVTVDDGVDDSASLAIDPNSGDLWVAWNSNRDSKSSGDESQHNFTDVMVRVLQNGKWYEPVPPTDATYEGQVSTSRRPYNQSYAKPYYHDRPSHAYAKVMVTETGNVWIFWRADIFGQFKDYQIMARRYSGAVWTPEIRVSQIKGHADQVSTVQDTTGVIWLAWQGQEAFPLDHDVYFSATAANNKNSSAYRRPVLRALHNHASATPSEIEAADKSTTASITSIDGLRVFYGDIHAHSTFTDGKAGQPDQLYLLARDRFKLDFFAMTDHADFDRFTPSQWAQAQDRASYFNRPGQFVTFSGFEWNPPHTGSGALEGGHRCVIYPTDDQPIFAGDGPASDSIPKLYRAIKKTNGIVIAHHMAHAGWGRWNPENYAPSIEPVIEITSTHGRFEYYGNPLNSKARPQVPGHSYQDALARGYRLGAVGSSDTHHMRPGYMGMTAVWAPELTRAAIFQAIRERRTFAITGDRIRLQFRMDGNHMGSEYHSITMPSIEVDVEAPSAIESVDIIKNNVAIHTVVRNEDFPDGVSTYLEYDQTEPQASVIRQNESPHRVAIEFVDSFFEPTAANNYYYVRVTLANGHQAWSSPIWVSGNGLNRSGPDS